MRHFLEFGEFQKGSQNVLVFKLAGRHSGDEGQLRQIWDEHQAEILRDWRRDYPCTRPWAWWRCDATEVRQQVGGSGYPMLTYGLEFGCPLHWMMVEESNPPQTESQARYLQRLKLLTTAEKRFLADNPDLLEPIALGDE